MDREKLEAQLRELPIVQYEFFDTRDLVFTERVREVCRIECPQYGRSWACPPAVGSVEECKARCLAYPHGLLIITMTEVDDIASIEATLATRTGHEAVTHQVVAFLEEQGIAP